MATYLERIARSDDPMYCLYKDLCSDCPKILAIAYLLLLRLAEHIYTFE